MGISFVECVCLDGETPKTITVVRKPTAIILVAKLYFVFTGTTILAIFSLHLLLLPLHLLQLLDRLAPNRLFSIPVLVLLVHKPNTVLPFFRIPPLLTPFPEICKLVEQPVPNKEKGLVVCVRAAVVEVVCRKENRRISFRSRPGKYLLFEATHGFRRTERSS